ncbi:MAG: hypothetical protein PHT02_07100 [Tissierellia bacterium]|nr:hypothetical protein [Tissierellia bacterium]
MNTYTVIKAFTDVDGIPKPIGSTITTTSARGVKLIKQGYVTVSDIYVEKLVDFRWVKESLEVYNKQTGAVLLRIPPTGLTSLSVNIIGNITGDVTGNVSGDLTGQVFGQVSTYIGDGQIAVTDTVAKLNGVDATCAMTLADGTEGQMITIKTIDITNTCSITPTNLTDGTSITLSTLYSSVTLVFDGTDWDIVSTMGTVVIA